MFFVKQIHPRNLTVKTPEKWMVGRQAFPFEKAYFQGRTVKLQGGNPYIWPYKWVTGVISPLQMELFHPTYNMLNFRGVNTFWDNGPSPSSNRGLQPNEICGSFLRQKQGEIKSQASIETTTKCTLPETNNGWKWMVGRWHFLFGWPVSHGLC